MTQLFDVPSAMRAWTAAAHRDGHTVAFVPTMGALHDGHLSLVELASGRADRVVVSIFVNPLQFDRGDDFDSYPRPIDDDLQLCRQHRVDAVFAPTAAAMYPRGFDTTVSVGALADTMEGAMRPGHFAGVTTVVSKLFGAVRPDVAVFGEKDFQQLVIIRRMVSDLDFGIEIVGAPTAREADGLAISSRNRRLSDDERRAAVCVPAALEAAAVACGCGESSPRSIEAAAAQVVAAEPLARLDYITVFDPETMTPLPDEASVASDTRIAIAVWFGDIRLIDNRSISA